MPTYRSWLDFRRALAIDRGRRRRCRPRESQASLSSWQLSTPPWLKRIGLTPERDCVRWLNPHGGGQGCDRSDSMGKISKTGLPTAVASG